MSHLKKFICVLSLVISSQIVFGNEFTFEVEDNDEECFSQVVEADKLIQIEYQVN